MGLTEGSYCPTSFAATNEASAPKRRGFNQGIQQCTFALFGLGFGPIIATQLMAVVPSWRWVEIFRSRNIVLSMAALLCAMTGVFVLSAMVPNYLVDYPQLTPPQIGFVMSAISSDGFVGQFGIPGLSDVFGRKIMAIVGFVGAGRAAFFSNRNRRGGWRDIRRRNCTGDRGIHRTALRYSKHPVSGAQRRDSGHSGLPVPEGDRAEEDGVARKTGGCASSGVGRVQLSRR